MYRKSTTPKTSLRVNESYEGETLEQKIHRIVNNNEPITDGAPLIYTERKDGVNPDYDVRTDRWEHAIDAMDKVSKSHIAKRENSIAERAKQGMDKEKGSEKVDGKPSTGDTETPK